MKKRTWLKRKSLKVTKLDDSKLKSTEESVGSLKWYWSTWQEFKDKKKNTGNLKGIALITVYLNTNRNKTRNKGDD